MKIDKSQFVDQSLFGGMDVPPEQRGNCFPACVASLIGYTLGSVPHFYAIHPDNQAASNRAIRAWLSAQGYGVICLDWVDAVEWGLNFEGSVVIVSGKSPRGPHEHAVLGRINGAGWELVHDPHPSRAGIEGDPSTIEYVFELPTMKAAA